MKLSKIIAAVISGIMLMSISVPAYMEETEEFNYSQMNWDGIANVNVKSVQYREGSAAATCVEKNGINVLQMRGKGPFYAIIDCDDKLFPVSDKIVPVAITVRYFDEGNSNAFFTLWYTGTTGPAEIGDKVVMTNTKEFKEYTFYIDEFYFKNNTLGGDVVIGMWSTKWGSSSNPVYIQSIKIERSFPQKPIKTDLVTGRPGNIFDIDDEKDLNVEITNISDSVVLDIDGEYQVTSFDGRVISEGVFPKKRIEPIKTESIILPNELSECGVYFLRTKLNYSGVINGEDIHREGEWSKKRFGVINKREPDEKLNPIMQTTGRFDIDGRSAIQKELLQMMADIGMSGTREQTSYNSNYRSDGSFNKWAQGEGFAYAKELGMNKMMALQMGSVPTGGHLYIPETPEAIDAYCDYAEYIVTNYDNVAYYEIWNEPNIFGVFNANSVSATGYTELVRAVYNRIKAIKPEVKIASLSTAQIQYSFIDEAIEAGILDCTDAITVHPYDWEESGYESRTKNNLYRERLQTLRKKLDDLGYPNVEIVFSEMGVRSGTALGSEALQAASNVQMFGISQGEGFVDGIYLFQFINEGLESDPNGEMHWGILHNRMEPEGSFTPKLCYVALAGHNKFLADAKPTGKILRDQMSVYLFRRNSDGKDVMMLWSDNDSDAIGIDLGTEQVEVFDMYSNKIGTLKSSDGKFSFTTSFEPIYVVGNFTKTEECQAQISVDDGRKYITSDDYTTFTITDPLCRNLEVDAKARDGIEIVSNSGMINGTAQIKVHTKADATKENGLEIRLFDKGEMVYASKYHVIIEEPMRLSSTIKKYHENSDTRYVAEIQLTNMANEKSITGTASADFTQIGGKKEVRKFFDVPPGKTVTVSMNLPEQLVQHSVDMLARIELNSGYVTEQPMHLTRNMAMYTETPPDITGKLDYSQWQGGDWFAADTKAQTRYLSNWTKEDCSMTGTVKWDAKNMYLLAIVEDDIFYQKETGSNVWSGDSLQFGICRGSERLKTGGAFTEFGLSRTSEGVQLFRFETQTQFNNVEGNLKTNILVENAECSVEEQDGKYIYRAKIPWYEVIGGMKGITEETNLGFSILVNDNDGTGRGWLEFGSGIGSTKDTQLYALMPMSLGGKTISPETIKEVESIVIDSLEDAEKENEQYQEEFEPGVFGKHTFDNGKDHGFPVEFGMQQGTSAGLSCEDGNWFIHTNANNNANTLQWLDAGGTRNRITDFWRSDEPEKKISIEFDIRNRANDTGKGETSIYFSRIHFYTKGLRIFAMDDDGNIGLYDLGGKNEDYRFNGIKGMDPDKWYHYKYVLDIVNKTACAELYDGENKYVIEEKTAVGDSIPWWSNNIKTEFNVLAINAPNGSVDIDNVVFKQLTNAAE